MFVAALLCAVNFVAPARPVLAAPGDAVKLDVGNRIWYGGIAGGARTNYFWANNTAAYCIDPHIFTPKPGTYSKSSVTITSAYHSVSDLRAAMWFAYGGPGFDARMWPSTNASGGRMTNDDYMVYSHIMLSEYVHGNTGITLDMCTLTFKGWYTANILGFTYPGSGVAANPNALASQIRARMAEVPPADEFDVYMIHTGNNAIESNGAPSQVMLGFSYVPRITVTFEKSSANTTLTAYNNEYSVADARYDIYLASDDSRVGSITTSEDGTATFDLLQKTDYYLVERAAPKGYLLTANPIPFTTGTSSSVITLTDSPETVTLRLTKSDSATRGAAQPGVSLADAIYVVTDANGDEHCITTNETGEAHIEGLPLGPVSIHEKQAPTGYKPNHLTHTFHTTSQEVPESGVLELIATGDFSEDVIAFDLDLVKYADSGADKSGIQIPAQGVRFFIISGTTNQTVATLVTDEAGRASTVGNWYGQGTRPAGVKGSLPYDQGGYIVREDPSTTPTGYQPAPDWHIEPHEMFDGVTLHFIVDNDFVESRLCVVKHDAETGQTVPLSGFTFEILDATGEPVIQELWYPTHRVLDTYTTDATGTVTMPDPLIPGHYTIREVSSPAPYLKQEQTVSFEISNSTHTPQITVVTMADNQAKGQATIVKVCNDAAKPDEPNVYDEDCTRELEGAVFNVIAQEDIISPDGTVRASKGEIVDQVTTGKDGRATTKKLYIGTGSADYAFIEIKAPDGHLLDSTPHPFTLAWKDDTTPLITVELEAPNIPTETILTKTILGLDEVLPDTDFALWNAADEIQVTPEATKAALVVRAEGASFVELTEVFQHALASVDVPEGWLVKLERAGERYVLNEGDAPLTPDTYQIAITDNNGKHYDLGDDEILQVEAGMNYRFVHHNGFLGIGAGVTLSQEPITPTRHTLKLNAEDNVFSSDAIKPGWWQLNINGTDVDTYELTLDTTTYLEHINEQTLERSHLLRGDTSHTTLTTGNDGSIIMHHLTAGTWRLEETAPPPGFVRNQTIHTFTIDETGLTEGVPSHHIFVENDYTKVEFSKHDITTEARISGAHLALLDSEENQIASWTSSETVHRIDRLPVGDYQLVELKTPHNYDEAQAVAFTVLETGEIQRVVMYDEPIRITGEIDKRQEIAEPQRAYTLADTTEDGGGSNRAAVKLDTEGVYRYTIDARSTASTWVDEFTITDVFDGAATGLAHPLSLTTPVAIGDYDGILNVWYQVTVLETQASDTKNLNAPELEPSTEVSTKKTNTDAVAAEKIVHPIGPKAANATCNDSYINPWLSSDITAARLGDDGRVIDYQGWHLWKAGLSTTEPTKLNVSDLNLAENEVICAIRLEYGRVAPSFTTRTHNWNRDDLKHLHDDLNPHELEDTDTSPSENINDTHTTDAQQNASEQGAPLIIEAQVLPTYEPSTMLENSATLELYRNGGTLFEYEQLEDDDTDQVVQYPVGFTPTLDTLFSGPHGAKTLEPGVVELTDTIEITQLHPDFKHIIRSSLVNKTTGETLKDAAGHTYKQETTFIPEEHAHTLTVPFTVDTRDLDGREIVAFQHIYVLDRDGSERLVATHTSLDDPDQTILIQSLPPLPATGTTLFITGMITIAMVSIGLGLWFMTRTHHRSSSTPRNLLVRPTMRRHNNRHP